MSKETIWFEVGQEETMEQCMERMKAEGYVATGRKEEPLFVEIDGNPVPIRQITKFKGIKIVE